MEQTTSASLSLRDADFKDASPLDTVEKIKEILAKNNIETELYWAPTGVPYCYATRLNVKGTTFGVNGKGLTREFATASAYGELMERLQLGYLGSRDVQKDGHYSANDAQDSVIPLAEVLQQNMHWYAAQAKLLHHYTGIEMTPEEFVTQFADKDGNVGVTPFFNATTGQKVYYPAALRKRAYSANGCAAGNSMAEAIVQGISEIVERHHQLRIIDEALTLPDVPEEYLQQYEVAYRIITYIREQGFRVIIKDCSLGEKFPVVGACIISEKTGKYHVHLGAYPIFEIALERALTESFQGRHIDRIASFEDFTYKKDDVYSVTSIAHELTKGTWEKMTSFFIGEPTYAFHEDLGFTGKTNDALLQECLAFFADQGYDVLIRDSSCLDFPTYQIIVPGYSEIFIYRLAQKRDDHRYAPLAKKAIRNLSEATLPDMLALLKHIQQMQQFTANMSDAHGFLATAKLAAHIQPAEDHYLITASLAYVYYTLGKHAETLEYLQRMLDMQLERGNDYLICLKRYLSLCINQYDPDEIRIILEFFHPAPIIEKLYGYLEQKKNPLEDYILHCNMQCTERCILHNACCQKHTDTMAETIRNATAGLNFDRFVAQLQALV